MLEDKDRKLTPVGELGEFKFIEHVTREFTLKSDQIVKGIGDDAAVYSVGDDEVQVASTDLLLEGVHFDLSYAPLQHVGYKSVVVNLSDIFAMNARPFGVLVSVAMSNRFTVEAMEAFYQGVKAACDRYGVDLLGGDTSSSHTGLVVSVTALGRGRQQDMVYRNGARENDLLCLTGNVGAAFAGLRILNREKSVFLSNPDIQPDLAGYDYVVGRQLKPEARADIIESLSEAGIRPTAMIDVSDGVASEVMHLCQESGLGAQVYANKIVLDHQTIDVAESFGENPLTMALNGGEDYELLFTARLEDFDTLNTFNDIHIIGHMTERSEGVNLVTQNGSVIPLEAQGWNHFQGGQA